MIYSGKKEYHKGFTLIELLVVISIIGVLSSVVLGATQRARARSYDSKVLLQVRQIVNALHLARNESTGEFPGWSGTFQCLKPSGVCYGGGVPGNTSLVNALQPYLATIPTPPNPPFGSNTLFYDSYVYLPNYPNSLGGSPAGTYLMYGQSKPITDCRGYYGGAGYVAGSWDGYYYCFHLVAPR